MPNIVKITSEQQHQELTAELLRVLLNLRFRQKYWEENYGCMAKKEKKDWEQKADQLLNRLGFNEHNRLKTIKFARVDDNVDK